MTSSTKRLHTFLLSICATGLFSSSAFSDVPWPQFRGPNGNGVIASAKPTLEFSDQENVQWKADLPGRGWSSPVVADGVIWVTTAIQTKADEASIQKRMEASGVKPREMKSREIAASIDLKLIGVDADTGKMVASIDLLHQEDPEAIHALNSYASPTPVIDGDHIYCHFGTYGTFAVNRQSETVDWKYRDKVVHAVGPGSSPFVEGNHLVLIHDGCERQSVIALNKTNGEVAWRTERPEMDAPDGDRKKAFCTPIAIDDPNGNRQLICLASQYIVSYEPSSGKEIWRCYHGKGFSVVPRPVYSSGTVYFATGFGDSRLLAVDVTGKGDVTESHVQWTVPKGMPQKPSPVVHDSLIYLITDSGVAMAIRTDDGEVQWKKRVGGNHSASPTILGNHLFFAAQDGTVTVMTLGENAKIIAENKLDGQIMASPAMIGHDMIWRAGNHLYRIGSKGTL